MQSRATMSLAGISSSSIAVADIPTHRPSGEAIPTSEQLMQVDQAITLTLQEIDANFAKCHQTITGKILPSIRRYGVASHNTWQGAKFWHRFFETASDINLVPTYEGDGEVETSQEPTSTSFTSQDEEASTSFSRPIRQGGGDADEDQIDEDTSRDALGKDSSGELSERDFEPPRLSEASRAATQRLRQSEVPFKMTEVETYSESKGRDNALNTPKNTIAGATPKRSGGIKLATQVLRNQHEQQSKSARKLHATPRRIGASASNPFAVNGKEGQSAKKVNTIDRWNGIADLRKTPMTKFKMDSAKGKPATMNNNEDTIGSLDWPPGMSPPVTMQFSVPQKKYAKTPAKAAAQLAVDDLLKTIEGASPATRRNLIQRIGVHGGGNSAGVNLTSTPLKRGHIKGRKSLPTPPTVTKRIGGTTRLSRGIQEKQSPAVTSSSAAARLLDEDEDGAEDEQQDDLHADLNKLTIAQTSAGIDKILQGGTGDEDDSEEEEQSDSDDDEDHGDVNNLIPSQSQKSSILPSKNGTDYPTNSSMTSNSRSIDQDTLFGIRDPNKATRPSSALKVATRFSSSSSSDAPMKPSSSSSTAYGASSSSRPSTFEPINPRLYEQGTVYGGRPMLNDDREDTYSAPSPTPATTSTARRSK